MEEENPKAEPLRKLSNLALYLYFLGQNILGDKCSTQFTQFLDLIGKLVPLFRDSEEIRRQISVDALRTFEEALDRAKNLAQLMRCGCKLYMALNRKGINEEFKNISSLFRRALFEELNIPDHDLKMVNIHEVKYSLEYFEELITMSDAPDLKLYEDMSCVYNQSKDVATDDGTLIRLCRQLHFYGVEDIKRESQVLKKVRNIPGDRNLEESENKMSVLLEKFENFLESQTVPDDFSCPISHQLMRDPVITCNGQTFERAFIEKWLNEENGTCPTTRETLCSTSLTSNRALQSFIKKWDRINGMEPFEKFGNSLSKLTFNHMEQEFGRGVPPEEFVCYLSEKQQPGRQKSAKLMKDPVIICTGETYEKAFIKKWLKAGRKTCPFTRESLSNYSYTPNRALNSLISNWHKVNGSSSSDQGMVVSTDYAEDVDILLSKLTSDKSEDRKSAAVELCYLPEHRYSILIPKLVKLLSSSKTDIQTRAITALRQLSFEVRDSRHCIISNAVPGILYVLENGSMEARGAAALTFRSLSTLNEYRATLGASGAIPALVKLLKDGGRWEKTASARALSELCKYEGNQGRAISADVVSMLLEELTESSRSMEDRRITNCSIFDEALDVMKLLVSHPDGKTAIIDWRPVPVLLLLLVIGSPRNKEIVLAILIEMQSHLAFKLKDLPQAKELEQILSVLNRDDVTSDEAEQDRKTLLGSFR